MSMACSRRAKTFTYTRMAVFLLARSYVCGRHSSNIQLQQASSYDFMTYAHRSRLCDVLCFVFCLYSTFCPVSLHCFYTITNERHRQKQNYFESNAQTRLLACMCVCVCTKPHTFAPHIHTNLFPLRIRLLSRSNVHCVRLRVSDKNTHGFGLPLQAPTNTYTMFCACVRQKTIST